MFIDKKNYRKKYNNNNKNKWNKINKIKKIIIFYIIIWNIKKKNNLD